MVDFEKKKQQSATKAAEPSAQPTLDPTLTQASTGVATVAETKTTAVTHRAVAVEDETGFEHMTQADFKVPFLAVLQGKSPQVEEGNPKQLPGAKAGSFMNTVTQELFDGKKGIVVVPIHSIHQYLEWIPRDDGGGLVNVYDWQAPEVLAVLKKAAKRFGKHKINDNNDLQESFNVFMLHLRDDGTRQPIVMGFASSQIGAYQAWMTTAKSQVKPAAPGEPQRPRALWSHRYRITTAFNQNKKGTWHKMSVTFDGPNAEAARLAEDDAITAEAKEFRQLLMSGAASANFESATQEVDGAEGTEGNYAM
jgi:hypothetical protein